MTGGRIFPIRDVGRASSRDWMHQAACRSQDPTPDNIRARANLFFTDYERPGPKTPEAARRDRIEDSQARTICATCPVTAQCEDYRAAHNIHYGTWGGTTENARRRSTRNDGGNQ